MKILNFILIQLTAFGCLSLILFAEFLSAGKLSSCRNFLIRVIQQSSGSLTYAFNPTCLSMEGRTSSSTMTIRRVWAGVLVISLLNSLALAFFSRGILMTFKYLNILTMFVSLAKYFCILSSLAWYLSCT